MAFCPKCGAEVTPGTQFCPKCGAQLSQETPAQPAYGKTTIDVLPNAENQYTQILTFVGLAGVVLSIIVAFIDQVESFKAYYFMSLLTSVCSCAAMVNIFFSLRKGLTGQREAMPSLLNFSAYLNMGMTAFAVILALVAIGADSLDDIRSIAALTVLVGVLSIVYFVCFLIVASKLVGAYEGKLKTLGLTFLAIPAIGILMFIIGILTADLGNISALSIIITIVMQAVNAYLYCLAYEIFTGKKLIQL